MDFNQGGSVDVAKMLQSAANSSISEPEPTATKIA